MTETTLDRLPHYLEDKNIMHTVRYTEPSPERFKKFCGD
jgi:hypothetical protein